MSGNKVADEDKVFVCLACGRMSKDRYGEQKISGGWDESCMMNSEEVVRDRLVFSDDGRRVIKVKE